MYHISNYNRREKLILRDFFINKILILFLNREAMNKYIYWINSKIYDIYNIIEAHEREDIYKRRYEIFIKYIIHVSNLKIEKMYIYIVSLK